MKYSEGYRNGRFVMRMENENRPAQFAEVSIDAEVWALAEPGVHFKFFCQLATDYYKHKPAA